MHSRTGGGREAAKRIIVERAGKIVGRVVSASAVLAAVVGLVERLVTFPIVGAWSKADVAALFVYAGARRTSLTQACADLDDAMSDSRLRQLWTGFEIRFVQPMLNRLLLVHAVKCLGHRSLRLAIDLTLIPYHGKASKNKNEVYRGPAKQGTSHFHAYATAYVILAGRRFTLCIKPVRKGDDLVGVIDFLLEHVRTAGFRLEALYVDRGFCNVACIRYFQVLECMVLMPLIIRGKKGERLLKTRHGDWFMHTMSSPVEGDVTFPVVVCVTYAKGRRGEHKAKKYAYVALKCTAKPRVVYERYRERFGIEASYRLMHRARARTCTRDPTIRLLLFGIALLLENEWVWTKYERLSSMRRGRGGRIVHHELLRFERFLAWLVHAVNEAFGFVAEILLPGTIHRGKWVKTALQKEAGNY